MNAGSRQIARIKFSILCAALLLSLSGSRTLAASDELKPVLKAIDPASAKMDEVPKPEPKPAPQKPNYNYSPYQSTNYNQNQNQKTRPASGSYGMNAPATKPYVPATQPTRNNQVFTPPWANKQAPSQQAQQGYGAPPQYTPQPQQQPQYGQPLQQQTYRQPQYAPQPNYGPMQQIYRQPQQQYYGQQPAYPPQNQYMQQRSNYQNVPRQAYGQPYQNQYQGQYQQPQYQQPQYQQQQYQQPRYQQPQYQQQQYQQPRYQQNQSANSGFPSDNMIPEFGKPLPVNATNKGKLGGRWTSNAHQGMFKQAASDPESRVARLEEKAFGSTYPEHDVEARVDHLEKEIFGTKSSGSIGSRLSKLEYKLGGRGAFSSSNSSGTEKESKKIASSKGKKNFIANKLGFGKTGDKDSGAGEKNRKDESHPQRRVAAKKTQEADQTLALLLVPQIPPKFRI